MKKILIISIVMCLTITFIAGLPLNGVAEVIHGCYGKFGGVLRILSGEGKCTKYEIPISWNSVDGINRVIRGTVNDDGTIAAGTGFTVAPPNETFGRTIKFDTPFSTTPTCVLNPLYSTCTSGICVDILDTIFFCDLFMSSAAFTYECFAYHPSGGAYCCDGAVPPVTFICTE